MHWFRSLSNWFKASFRTFVNSQERIWMRWQLQVDFFYFCPPSLCLSFGAPLRIKHGDLSDLYPHAVFVLLCLQVVYFCSCHVLPPEPTANVAAMVTQSPTKQKSNEANCCCGMAQHPMALEDGLIEKKTVAGHSEEWTNILPKHLSLFSYITVS